MVNIKKLLLIVALGVAAYFLLKQFKPTFLQTPLETEKLTGMINPFTKKPLPSGISKPGETIYSADYIPANERKKQRKKGRNIVPLAPSITKATKITHVTAKEGTAFHTRTGGGELNKWIGGR